MAFNRDKLGRAVESLVVLTAVSGIALTLWFVFSRLRFFFGVDYHMVHGWMAGYLKTGVFYPPDSLFYNAPLAVLAFGPWLFLPVHLAIVLKFIQTAFLSGVCIFLLLKLRPDMMKNGTAGPFALAIMAGTFFVAQLSYLNIYVEVAACLMAFLFFLDRGKEKTAAFFLALSMVFKVFLAPLLLVPLLTKNFRLLGWSLGFLACLGFLSLALFGLDTHRDMLGAMGETYGKMRLHGIGYPYVSDSFAGWQDFFNKLSVTGILDRGMVLPLTFTMAGLYVCLFLYTCFLLYRISGEGERHSRFTEKVFATVLVFCIGFNFRFDHGVLLFAALPFFRDFRAKDRVWLTASLALVTLSRLLVEKGLELLGFPGAQHFAAGLFYVLSFQFIGINLLLFAVVNHWSDRAAGGSGFQGKMDE